MLTTPIAHVQRDYGMFIYLLKDITPRGLAIAMEGISKIPKSTLLEKGISARNFMLENRTWYKRTLDIVKYMGLERFENIKK